MLVRSKYMKRELLPSDVVIGSVNKRNRDVSLVSTASPLMTDVKVKDVVAENAIASGVELRSAGRNAYEQL